MNYDVLGTCIAVFVIMLIVITVVIVDDREDLKQHIKDIENSKERIVKSILDHSELQMMDQNTTYVCTSMVHVDKFACPGCRWYFRGPGECAFVINNK